MDTTFLPKNASFDFVSVDGRARVACMSRALQILKPVGGVLLMDNSDRCGTCRLSKTPSSHVPLGFAFYSFGIGK